MKSSEFSVNRRGVKLMGKFKSKKSLGNNGGSDRTRTGGLRRDRAGNRPKVTPRKALHLQGQSIEIASDCRIIPAVEVRNGRFRLFRVLTEISNECGEFSVNKKRG